MSRFFSMPPPEGSYPVCIYGLFDQRDGQIRYVGKTSNPARRLRDHLRARTDMPVSYWVESLIAENQRPGLTILRETNSFDWPEAEQEWIFILRSRYRAGVAPKLLNVSSGGLGGNHHSESVRNRLSQMNTGERASNTHLNERQVMQIRKLYKAGGVTYIELGVQFGLSKPGINAIISGANWKHLAVLGRPEKPNLPKHSLRGEKIGTSRLTESAVIEMRLKYATDKYSLADLAKHFNLPMGTIHSAVVGKTWKYLNVSAPPVRRQHYACGINAANVKLNENQVREIRTLYSFLSCSKIARLYGVSHSAIKCIVLRRTWTHIL